MLYINMVYTYYIVCVTCVLIEQLMPARPQKTYRLPLMKTYRHTDFPWWFLEAA